MIQIKVIASSSSGNCYLVQDGSTQLLLECGIAWDKIQQRLNFKTSGLSGCLVTHEHQDHAKSIAKVLGAGIDVYTSRGTAEVTGVLEHHRLHVVKHGDVVKAGSWLMAPFSTEHDAAEPLGFLLRSTATGERLLFATDTYFIQHRFPPLDYIMIECNYSEEIVEANVESGKLPLSMVPRLMHSHMSLDTLKDFLRAQDLRSVKKIWLLHLSDGNSNENQFRQAVTALTGVPVEVAPKI